MDRLTFDAQLSNTSIACFSIESIDWHELGLHVAEDTVFQKKIFCHLEQSTRYGFLR